MLSFIRVLDPVFLCVLVLLPSTKDELPPCGQETWPMETLVFAVSALYPRRKRVSPEDSNWPLLDHVSQVDSQGLQENRAVMDPPEPRASTADKRTIPW